MRRAILIAASLGALVLTWALRAATPPLVWLAWPVPLAYLVLLYLGVTLPRFALFAPMFCRGPRSRPEVALTFDDGPDTDPTRKVLAALARAQARATFFVLGSKARQAPEVVAEIAAAGHEIGIHGDTHDRWLSVRHPDAIAASLERALATVESASSRRPHLFRPPLGHTSPRTAVAARRLGLALVGWSVRSRDGLASTTAEDATRRVRAGLAPGAVILMHDASERSDREPVAAAALPAILDEIARRGLRCVTISQLRRAEE